MLLDFVHQEHAWFADFKNRFPEMETTAAQECQELHRLLSSPVIDIDPWIQSSLMDDLIKDPTSLIASFEKTGVLTQKDRNNHEVFERFIQMPLGRDETLIEGFEMHLAEGTEEVVAYMQAEIEKAQALEQELSQALEQEKGMDLSLSR